jgi:hypothetical protein
MNRADGPPQTGSRRGQAERAFFIARPQIKKSERKTKPFAAHRHESAPIGTNRHQSAPIGTNWHESAPIGTNRAEVVRAFLREKEKNFPGKRQ